VSLKKGKVFLPTNIGISLDVLVLTIDQIYLGLEHLKIAKVLLFRFMTKMPQLVAVFGIG
jgi:hypothetical protein